jgi:predicted phage tail protein
MDDINYQCWICPFCHDDHNSDGPCGENALKAQITKLRNHLNDEWEKNKQRQTDTENHQRAKHQMREALERIRELVKDVQTPGNQIAIAVENTATRALS